jgi:hypothetical protein
MIMSEQYSEDNLDEILDTVLERYISIYWLQEEAITVSVGIGKNDKDELCIMQFVLYPDKVKNVPEEFEGLKVQICQSGGIPKAY